MNCVATYTGGCVSILLIRNARQLFESAGEVVCRTDISGSAASLNLLLRMSRSVAGLPRNGVGRKTPTKGVTTCASWRNSGNGNISHLMSRNRPMLANFENQIQRAHSIARKCARAARSWRSEWRIDEGECTHPGIPLLYHVDTMVAVIREDGKAEEKQGLYSFMYDPKMEG